VLFNVNGAKGILRTNLVGVALALIQFGCGAEERADFYDGKGVSPSSTDNSSAAAPLTPSLNEYPEGPYGKNNPDVGDTLENLTFFGFHRLGASQDLISKAEYNEFSFTDYRESGADYLLIHVAAAWCSSCLLGAQEFPWRQHALQSSPATASARTS
jgi:hypothetical protein